MATAQQIVWVLLLWCTPSLLILARLIWVHDIGTEDHQVHNENMFGSPERPC
jgi:hypothetical protein